MDRRQHAKAQEELVRLATARLKVFWDSLDLTDPNGCREALAGFWPFLIEQYGEVAATLAADRFEELTGMRATMARAVDEERALSRMNWAIRPLFNGEGDAYGLLALLLDELVKQPGRSTMIASARDNRIRYARVPVGDTCAFCLMLASRGAVYVSRSSAGDRGSRFHGKCDCAVEPVRDDYDLDQLKRQGYDPDELYDKYLTAREKAGSGSTSTVLSELREQEGTN